MTSPTAPTVADQHAAVLDRISDARALAAARAALDPQVAAGLPDNLDTGLSCVITYGVVAWWEWDPTGQYVTDVVYALTHDWRRAIAAANRLNRIAQFGMLGARIQRQGLCHLTPSTNPELVWEVTDVEPGTPGAIPYTRVLLTDTNPRSRALTRARRAAADGAR